VINIILVDDHRVFCDGLEKLLTETGQFNVTHTFYNGRNLLENLTKPYPDLLLLDIEMPGFTGLDVISRIKLNSSQIKIVMLSMHEENVYSKEAFSLGADAYLIKSIESSMLIDALVKVYQG
jgi:DNA-binding NarL/FixJ family response regulator